jgi:Tfp pilus assembly protein PilP
MKIVLISVLIMSLFYLQGCDSKSPTSELEKWVNELSEKLEATQAEIDTLKKIPARYQ